MDGTFILKDADTAEHFTAGDLCSLAEIFHPGNERLPFCGFSLSHAVVPPKGSTVPHRLIRSSEVYWIIEGEGTIFIDQRPIGLKKGRAVLVPPSAVQYVVNECDRDLEFLCIVSPPWESSDEEIL